MDSKEGGINVTSVYVEPPKNSTPQDNKESSEKQGKEQGSLKTAKETREEGSKDSLGRLEKQSKENESNVAAEKDSQERQSRSRFEAPSKEEEENKASSENAVKDNRTQGSKPVSERHNIAQSKEKTESKATSPLISKTIGVSSTEDVSQPIAVDSTPGTSSTYRTLAKKGGESKQSKEDVLEVQPTMDSDLSEGKATIEVSGISPGDIVRSPMKDSQLLDPNKANEETNIMDLVARYEEQPTMMERTLRVLRKIIPKKGKAKPKRTSAPPKRTASRQRRSKDEKHKKGLDEETVFDNEDDAKKEMAEHPYDNLGEDEEEEKIQKRSAVKGISGGEAEAAEEVYENLPTPPDSKEKKKQKGKQRRMPKGAARAEQGEMRTAERTPTSHDQRRKGTTYSESTAQAERASEMMTQNEPESSMGIAEDLSEYHTDGMSAIEDEEMETAVLTPHTLEKARRVEVKMVRARPKVAKTTLIRTVVDILSIMCLLPLANEFYVVPIEALQHGGFVFILLYIFMVIALVLPVLSLVLFVSQYTQTGIVYVFRMYGSLFQGFGYGYLSIIFMLCISVTYKGSILVKHNAAILFDSLSIGSCANYPASEWSKCSSLFLDAHCMALNKNYSFFARGFCWKFPVSESSEMSSSTDSYLKLLLSYDNGSGFDSGMFIISLLQLLVLGALAVNGPTVLSILLAVMTIVFIMVILINNIVAVNGQSMILLRQFSDFGQLAHISVWIHATRLAFHSSGLGEATIFCISSFRSPRGRYFLTSSLVIAGRILFCILGLFSLLGGIAELKEELPSHRTLLLPKDSDIVFSPSLAVDIYSVSKDFSHRLYDNAEVLYILHIAPAFAPLFTMYAVARKHGASSFIEYMPFIGAFLIFCSFYSFLLCTDAFHTLLYSHNKLMIACSLHFYMALTIFLFAFCYGFKELNSDIKFLFPRTKPKLRKIREQWHKGAFLMSILILLVLQICDIVSLCSEETKRLNEFAKQKKTWQFMQECFAIILAPIPFVIPAVVILLKQRYIKKKRLLVLSNSHPTKRRRRLQKARRRKKMARSVISRKSRMGDLESGRIGSDEIVKEITEGENRGGSSEQVDTKGSKLIGSKEENVERQSKETVTNNPALPKKSAPAKKVHVTANRSN